MPRSTPPVSTAPSGRPQSSLVGDRATTSRTPANATEAIREIEPTSPRAPIIMVKPGQPHLDIIAAAAEISPVPVAAYQISGEYSQIVAAADNGWIDRERVATEVPDPPASGRGSDHPVYFCPGVGGVLVNAAPAVARRRLVPVAGCAHDERGRCHPVALRRRAGGAHLRAAAESWRSPERDLAIRVSLREYELISMSEALGGCRPGLHRPSQPGHARRRDWRNGGCVRRIPAPTTASGCLPLSD